MVKSILMIIAPKNFRDEEYFVPKEIFLKEHYKVVTASTNTDVALGKLGGTANIDIDIEEVNSSNYDCVCFIGGSGAIIYKDNKTIMGIIKDAFNLNKLVCAICIAPVLLALSGVLKGKNATVWNGDGEQEITLRQNGAIYQNITVVIDQNIITANGPMAAEEFAKKIVDYLKK